MTPRFASIFFLVLAYTITNLSAQTRKVLFLGNSYTAYNNLPQLVHDVALSAGDTLIFDSNTPGGYTLEDHSIDPTSQNKIIAGGWDYVVLQGQSQEPIVQTSDFNQGAFDLENIINQYNPCAVTMLYMTWGRKNGDASNCVPFPVMCTYTGMDSTLRNKYIHLADFINAEISPVSVVWNYLRQHHPGIELYQADESHPSAAGSYAAACCFYTTIFKKDPTLISYNGSLSTSDAAIIRNATKLQVFDHLSDWDYSQLPHSGFNYSIGAGTNEVIFNSINYSVSQTYFWDFGDGTNSSSANPSHSYLSNGTYVVTLTTTNCDLDGTHISISDTIIQFCAHTPVITASHPWLCEYDTLWTQGADSYQWYCGGSVIPATNQFLADYYQYGSMGFSVLTTVAGCSEMSQVYAANPELSGYYFDAAMGGDPCVGDTALFIVLHTSSSLSGSEIIHWYKDGVLLALPTDMDTLFITTEGTYQCRVIDSLSHCPFDTTISTVEFNCNVFGLNNPYPSDISWKIYPNPASELVTIELPNITKQEEISIYSSTGYLVKTMKATSKNELDISLIPAGQYYIRLRNYPQVVIKLIKL